MRRLVLATLIVTLTGLTSAAASTGKTTWSELQHRALDLLAVESGQPCPVSSPDDRIDWEQAHVGEGYGRGPAYPILSEGAEASAGQSQGDRLGAKALWYVRPEYKGRVLVRGARLDAPGKLAFAKGRKALPGLRIDRGETTTWSGRPPGSRGVPSYFVVRSPGCYGVQVDAAHSSRTVVFVITAPE